MFKIPVNLSNPHYIIVYLIDWRKNFNKKNSLFSNILKYHKSEKEKIVRAANRHQNRPEIEESSSLVHCQIIAENGGKR